MKLCQSQLTAGTRSERASVLIIVLWVCIGLVSIALYFANSMTYELRASDNRVDGLAADQAIEGAARYVSYVLANYATNGAMPDPSQFACAAVPVGEARFWLIGRDPSAGISGASTPGDPYFGLVDESSKFNLNTVNTNMLGYLPNMTADFAEAIQDWRGTNGVVSLDYASLGYLDKNAPFETVDELRLVYGANMELLAGDDLNGNGVLDGNEKDTSGTGEMNYGLFEYTTVWTREPNFHSDGSSLTNVNTATQATLQTLLEDSGVSDPVTMARSMYTYVHNGAGGGGGGGGVTSFNNNLDLAFQCQRLGMSEADFDKISDNVTTSNVTYFRGRVNVNTASADVLTALFEGLNVDNMTASGAAQTLVSYREQNEGQGTLDSIWWVMDALGNNSPVITALRNSHANSGGGWVTTKTYQFTADIAAAGPYGRGYRRVKFIFDTSNGSPIILYRQDLSGLGWALGDKVRETLLASNTAQ